MTNAATVFISNKASQHNYTPAAQHGAMKSITSGNYSIFKTVRLRDEIIKVLLNSEKTDFLLLSGSSVIAGICMSIWLLMHDEVKLLLYDRKERSYVIRTLSKSDIKLAIETALDEARER